MSARNGDRARFYKDRRRKMLRRQRIQALVRAVPAPTTSQVKSDRLDPGREEPRRQ